MNRLLTLFGLLIITLALLSLSGCTMLGGQQNTTQISAAAQDYLQKAAQAQGDEQHQYQLMALKQLLADNNLNDSQQLLTVLNHIPLNVIDTQYKLILKAQLALQKNQPRRAVQILRAVKNPKQLPQDVQMQYYTTSMHAYYKNNNVAYSTLARMSLNQFLSEDAKQQNEQMIWRNLLSLPTKSLQSLLHKSQSKILRGFLQLALIAKQDANDAAVLANHLQTWRQKYPDHIANQLLPNNDVINTIKQNQPPVKIALFLPLHGPFAQMGKAVQNGFMTAFYANAKYLSTPPALKIYDTSQNDVDTLYQQAIDDGVQFIIGPLTKDNVHRLAKNGNASIPILALNYLNQDQSVPDNFIQFGLSPTQAAEQSAQLTWQHNANNLLVITPDNDWGTHVQQAFMSQFQQLGGRILTTLNFSDIKQLGPQIASTFNIDQSRRREECLQKLLDEKIKAIPRKRQDIRGIFLVATPTQARQIIPLLKFYYAGNLPMFSISNIYSGYPSPLGDHDLNGLYFNDMPLLLSDSFQNLRAKLQKLWPENFRQNNRLFAVGVDAYLLSHSLPRLTTLPNFPLQGATGRLTLLHQRIVRQLLSARFKQGVPHRLST